MRLDLFQSFVQPRIFRTLFLSLQCFVRIFNVIKTGAVCLDVWSKYCDNLVLVVKDLCRSGAPETEKTQYQTNSIISIEPCMWTSPAVQATISSYLQLCGIPFEMSIKLCNAKLSYGTQPVSLLYMKLQTALMVRWQSFWGYFGLKKLKVKFSRVYIRFMALIKH